MHDVIVIGGGVVGLAVARELASRCSVLLLERGVPGRQASWAAAGMLCPHGEASEDGALFRLGLAGLDQYPVWAAGLGDETGLDLGFRQSGTLVLASSEVEWNELRSRHAWQHASGLGTRLLDAADVKAAEPALTLDLAGALSCPRDHQVHPRRLLEALRQSCLRRGVEISSGVRVEEVRRVRDRVTGVRAGADVFDAGAVVVAGGAWSGQIDGLCPAVDTFPRKGQILALRMDDEIVRSSVRWRQFYLVPRAGGELVVGATNENCGFDRSLTAGGMRQILDAAARMAASTGALAVRELWTGLRPVTSDELPVIGQAGLEGLFYAFGHYRNGVLQAPVTAGLIGACVTGTVPGPDPAFSPLRFSGNQRFATRV